MNATKTSPTNTHPHTSIATGKITQCCGRCGGTGRYYYSRSETGDCFGCNGRGLVVITQAAWSKFEAQKATAAAYIERERADELATETAATETYAAIARHGLDGARAMFRKFRDRECTLAGVIGAMRDEGMHDEANAVVRWNAARNRAASVA